MRLEQSPVVRKVMNSKGEFVDCRYEKNVYCIHSLL